MSDFVSSGWSVYVALITVLGLVGCFVLLMYTARSKSGSQGETTGHVWDEDLKELNNPMPRWWMMLFIITIVFGGGYLLLYPGLGSAKGALGWSSASQWQQEQQQQTLALAAVYGKYAATPFADLAKDKGAMAIGERLFINHCAACHGPQGQGVAAGLNGGRLVGRAPLLDSPWPDKTIGQYWPQASTVFDYVRRAMPLQAPGSLSADEVYALTAWLLQANGILADDAVLDALSLPQVRMPNRDGFLRMQR